MRFQSSTLNLLGLAIGLSGCITLLLLSIQPVRAESIIQVKDLPQTSTRAADLFAQEAQQSTISQVTKVQLNRTEAGLEIVLDTQDSKPLQVDATKFRTEGNSLIADLPNAVLTLPDAQAFNADNPTGDIANVRISQLDAATIRVSVTGINALPKTEVTLKTGAFAYSLNPEGDDAEEEELVVTGENEGRYFVPDTSTATKTDTPVQDLPLSIQIVPQQVLEDQNVTRLDEAIRNVPGVVNSFPPNFANGAFFAIRGFDIRNDSGNVLRNGLPDFIGTRQIDFSHIQQVEVLKGPASVLFGSSTPGGTINLITKQPLRDPFYEVNATIGNNDFYRGTVDLSGPLTTSKTALYRLNAAYQNTGSFTDFKESERVFVAPVVSFALGDRTKLAIEGEYSSSESGVDLGLPAVGTVLPNPNGRIPLNRTVAEPFAKPFDVRLYRIGYTLEHQFNDNLSLRNAFRVSSSDATQDEFTIASLEADNRTVNRGYRFRTFDQTSYNFAVDLGGKFSTGFIKHQVVFGVDLGRYDESTTTTSRSIAPLDLFNPVYGEPLGDVTSRTDDGFVTDTLGIYIQDQVTLTDNLKLLIGGRFDLVKQTSKDFLANTEGSESSDAFSPRVGIVYQPIPPISLYASYSRSFSPVSGIALDGSRFQPERGTQYEVGVKADLNNRLSATLAFYDLTRSNVLTADPTDPNFSIQTGEQRSRGIELNLAGELLPGWNIFAGYSYMDARITKDNTFPIDNRVLNAPENSFNLWTTYEIQRGLLQGFGGGLGFFFVGERQGDLENSFTLPSYFRTDASVFYRRGKLRVALNIRNLFNVDYFESSFSDTFVFPGEPFAVQGTISWQF
jgi:iron complex outermembrane recepter protein